MRVAGRCSQTTMPSLLAKPKVLNRTISRKFKRFSTKENEKDSVNLSSAPYSQPSKGIVNKFIQFSSVDGPGNRFVIFLQGCNLNCLYCHNPETIVNCNHCNTCVGRCQNEALASIDGKVVFDKSRCEDCGKCEENCPRGATPKTQCLSAEEVMKEVLKVREFIRGITVSGGECTLQLEFLTELFKLAKQEGLTTFIDTNGMTPLWNDYGFMDLVDGIMLDIKAYSEEEHKKLTCVNNSAILRNFDFLLGTDKLYEVRTVIAEGVCDNVLTVSEVSKKLAKANSHAQYKLIKYRTHGVREASLGMLDAPSDERMEELKDIASSYGIESVIIV